MFSLIGSEIKVILVVVAGLLAGEAGLRIFGEKLSHDVMHLRSFEQMAARFEHQEVSGNSTDPQASVLFLGNSMTRYGINPKAFDEAFHEHWQGKLEIAKLNPDNTALADWAVAYENFFYKQHRSPDLLVIGFEGRHLADRPSNHRNRLAHYYFDEDLASLRNYDLKSFEDLVEFELEHYSSLVANRDRVQTRVLDMTIPQYRTGIQELNHRQKSIAQTQAPPATYERLEKLLKHLHEQNVAVALVAMPVVDPYRIDLNLTKLLQKHKVTLLDCRYVPGITEDMIPDGVHMNDQASEIYSRYLAHELASREISLLVGK